jgi:hypothetical protein
MKTLRFSCVVVLFSACAPPAHSPIPFVALPSALHVQLHSGIVGLWVSNAGENYILGQTKNGVQTVVAIDAQSNGCVSPLALKVDHARNLWVACESGATSANSGVVQEYTAGAKLSATYSEGCPKPTKYCSSWFSYGYDEAVGGGAVFTSILVSQEQICNPSCTQVTGAGFEWWAAGKNFAAPGYINVGNACTPVCEVDFMDLDASGNIWFDYYGYNAASNQYGYGLGEIVHPTSKSWAFVPIEPPGTYGFAGGVYVSHSGKTLNVTDQTARTIAQYHLPVTPNAKPFKVLGPTFVNSMGLGDPVSGGFNQAETNLALGDAYAWIDIGQVGKNAWRGVTNTNFYGGLDGAAYTPSDK